MAGFEFVAFNARGLEALDDLDFRVEVLSTSAASSVRAEIPPRTLGSFFFATGPGVPDARDAALEESWFLLRLCGTAFASSCSEEALRFRNDREPSSGSSSRIRVLKTECESGRKTPRCAGSKSLVNFDAEGLLREAVSSVISGSKAFSTHPGHRHFDESELYQYRIRHKLMGHTVKYAATYLHLS